MAETTIRTLVCSVMFLDIVDYSKRSVGNQQHAKQMFNELLAGALEPVQRRGFIVIDNGDSAAIDYLCDTEITITDRYAARDHTATLPADYRPERSQIILGP